MPRVLIGCVAYILSLCVIAAPEPHWVNSGLNNRDITFSPDGDVLLTTIMSPKNLFAAIAVSHKIDGEWAPLEIAPFSGEHQDIEAMFAPDGMRLFFSSKRPKPDRDGDDWDIWEVAYNAGAWSEPVNLGAPVNTTGDEYYPSIANNSNLYFTATREGGMGGEDIYRAIFRDGRFIRVENLGDGVNKETYEFNAFVAPGESYLIFGSQRRQGELGGGDLYLSVRKEGVFQSATMMQGGVNSKRLDYCPSVFNGRLYFTSERTIPLGVATDIEALSAAFRAPGNGLGDIYSVPFEPIN